MRILLEQCRYYWTDRLRGQGEPPGWEDRFDIDREQWSEIWLLYERDLMIQEDMEWLVEAVFTFYRKHLDKLIRENDRMWGDSCQKKYDDFGNEVGLQLNTYGYDMTDPHVEVPMNKKTVIPDPERHFSFSTKLMVLAIELYQLEAPKDFCPYTIFAHRKLTQIVDSRKDLTAQSYRFFVEHAYNHFFQHKAFHQSASARTKARDLHAGEFHTSTKLDGYVWVANTKKISHVPKDQADDVDMEDEDDEDETQFLPSLQVIVRPQEETKNERGVSSLQEEETPQRAAVSSDDDEIVLTDLARINSAEDRYGCFIVRQLKTEHQLLLKDLCMSSQNVLRGDDLEGISLRRDEIGYFSLLFFMEYVADTALASFMEVYVPSTQTEISYDTYHEFHLDVKRVIRDNKHITLENFEDVEEPDLNDDDPNIPLQRQEDQHRGDPEFKGKLETLALRTSTLFWKQKMMSWWSAQSSGLACATRQFRRRS